MGGSSDGRCVGGASAAARVETKADRDYTSGEVAGKRKGAQKWVRIVNAHPDVKTEWRYLLLFEQDIDDASDSWARLKEFGIR